MLLMIKSHSDKFVAMQQNSTTLIYDLNKTKCTVESYPKRNLQSHWKQYSSKSEKSHLVLEVSKNRELVMSQLKFDLFII